MQILVHGGVHFARVFFTCTHALSHGCLWSHMLLHRDIFARRHRGTERMLFYTNTFTERWFHTEQFYTETKTSRGAFTKECMCTKVFSYSIFTQTYYIIILNYFLWRTRVWRKEFSTHAKSKFHHSFWWSRRMSWERVGPGQTHIAILPQCMTIDILCERVAFRGHQSTLPCRSKRKS